MWLKLIFLLQPSVSLIIELSKIQPYGGETLQKILVPRISGSEAHNGVKTFIKQELTSVGWHLEEDAFETLTTEGRLKFTNLIFTFDTSKPKKLIIAAHYDLKSKMSKNFTGAVDAGWSCAYLIELGKAISRSKSRFEKSDLTPVLIFFDGEEAFKVWNPPFDGLLGSNHLAQKLEDRNELNDIVLFILLDLIGSKDAHISNYQRNILMYYKKIMKIQDELYIQGEITVRPFLNTSNYKYGVEDDHTPFLKRGVPVFHMIPNQFPKFWHSDDDNISSLDPDMINSLSEIISRLTYDILKNEI